MSTNILQQEIEYHFQHMVIASFVEPKIPIHCIVDWVGFMNAMVKINVINFRIEARRGFIFLKSIIPGTKKLLMLTPHNTPWATTIYQEWMLSFNPEIP
jgi:hypothetical protein